MAVPNRGYTPQCSQISLSLLVWNQCIYFSLSPKATSLIWPQLLGRVVILVAGTLYCAPLVQTCLHISHYGRCLHISITNLGSRLIVGKAQMPRQYSWYRRRVPTISKLSVWSYCPTSCEEKRSRITTSPSAGIIQRKFTSWGILASWRAGSEPPASLSEEGVVVAPRNEERKVMTSNNLYHNRNTVPLGPLYRYYK